MIKKRKEKGRFIFCDLKRGLKRQAASQQELSLVLKYAAGLFAALVTRGQIRDGVKSEIYLTTSGRLTF